MVLPITEVVAARRRLYILMPAAILAATLAGCGGDSGSQDVAFGQIEPIVPSAAAPGQSVGLGIRVTAGEVADVSWRQLSGPSVVFHATRSKLIGFDIPAAGAYSFEVTLTASDGRQRSQTLSFTASGSRPDVNARLDRAVTERGAASLRAWHGFGSRASVTYRWEQISGPAATFESSDQPVLLFDAPTVAADSLLTFRVTVTEAGGRSASDDVWVLVEQTAINEAGYFPQYVGRVTQPVHAFQASSPHAAQLAACTYSNVLTASCMLGRLPLLAQETLTPSVADVMNRVVVSHDWMGQRLQEFLLRKDDRGEIRRLLRAVTAVVISDDVRPAFYWSATGAIYVDPDYLWLTPDERDTVDETPDFRSDFGNDLQFTMPWRLVKGNDYASYYYPPEWRQERPFDEIGVELGSLLYHELAHANDAFPSTRWAGLQSTASPLSASDWSPYGSAVLEQTYPLGSEEMKGLALVSFHGDQATDLQKSYLPLDVAGFFEPDRTADFYSYSTAEEDFATLFEFLMLRNRLGIDADIAATNLPRGTNITGRDYIVTWGQRGRIGEEKLKPRARFVAGRVLPELDADAALAGLPAPRLMTPGLDWIANLDLGGAALRGLQMSPDVVQRAIGRPVEIRPRHAPPPRLPPR
jgi:hypothetical protein